jgi:DNA polymerase delta subunit 1
MVQFQAISWEAGDDPELQKYTVHIFGRTQDGKSVCVTTPFAPYFFIKLNKVGDNEETLFKLAERMGLTTKDDEIKPAFKNIKLKLIRSKDLYGFQNNQEYPYIKLEFQTLAEMKKCEYAAHKAALRVYEANIDPFLRMMHRTGIKSTGWLEADGEDDMFSTCDINLFVKNWSTLKPLDRDDIAPFRIVSFDIETNSSTGKFPDPLVEGDACFQIALTSKVYGSGEIREKICLCYKETHAQDTKWYSTEKELLEAFQQTVQKMDPDVMTGYNIFGFDLEYLFKRAKMCKAHGFYNLGRIRGTPSELVIKRLSSGALGDNILKMLPMPGRYTFDLFHEIKREKKLDSYSLNSVSKIFLGDTKIDMPAKEMFKRYREEDPRLLGEVAEYCLKDTMLPHQLIDKLCVFTNLVEMAKATWVPLSWLSERAQQIKVFSQITRKARELNFKVPTIKHKYGGGDDKYEGATVLEAHTGAYYTPITALDFASLYPSIMMAHNLCFSTLVLSPKYEDLPGVEYETFDVGEGKTYKFAQNVPSLLPVILDELKQFRKKAKKLMAQARGTQMEEVYNGQQLAYKISMNSIYGFCGARRGILPCVPIAASTTCQGRNMIGMTKKCVEENFPGAVVRYGDTDSVMVEFDSKGLSTEEAIRKSWELGEKAAEMCNKLFKKPNDLELEKVYCPYILYSKKRYAAKMWTRNKSGEMEMEKVDVKGLQLVRRDNTPYTREVCKEVLNKILDSRDPKPGIDVAKQMAQELLDGNVPMEKLLMSKTLADSYKTKNGEWSYKHMMDGRAQEVPSQPHVQVLEKINKRTPGAHPHTGDRVPFVLVKTDDPKAKLFEKAEDPKYVKENSIPLDYNYYFTNQLKKPVEDLLEPLIGSEDIFATMMPPKPPRKKRTPKSKNIAEMFKSYEQNVDK